MTGFDFDRPYIDASAFAWFRALDRETAELYGSRVQAATMANFEYAARHARFSKSTRMKPPPSTGRKFPGYLVVRKVGQVDQYETWMPEVVFEDLYAPIPPSAEASSSSSAKQDDA